MEHDDDLHLELKEIPGVTATFSGSEGEKDARIRQLEEQLHACNDQLQATIEQLETSNEGLMSMNEELVTINAELREKVAELDQAICDMENLFTSSEIATVFLDRQLTIKRFSPAFSSIFDIIPAYIGRPFRHLARTSGWPDLDSDAKTVLERLTPLEREVAAPEGGKYYLMRILPYRTTDGAVNGIVATLIDITERKKAEERTRHLASFPELNPNPVLELDAGGKVIFNNAASQKVLQSLGMNETEVNYFLPDDMDDILRGMQNKQESSLYREISIKDRTFAETINLMPQFGVVRIYAIDMTERKRAADALRQSEERYRGLFDHMQEGYAYCRMLFGDGEARDFIYLAVNDAFQALTGLKGVVGKRVTEVIPGIREQDPGIFEIYARVALSGEPARFETYVESLGMWFDISVYSPEREYFVAVFDVITKRKEAEEEVRRLNLDLEQRVIARTEELRNLSQHLQTVREKERASISRDIHDDLGQLLTALKMDLAWLMGKLPEGHPQLIEKSLEMKGLFDEAVRTVQRICAELRPAILDDLGLTAAIEWHVQEFQKRTGIICDVQNSLDCEILEIGLSTTLFRIFQETLTNISRHAQATRVEVNLSKKGDELVAVIKDNGKGITEEQLHDHQSLGLIGMRERARSFGGEVIISRLPNGGTGVQVIIPLIPCRNTILKA